MLEEAPCIARRNRIERPTHRFQQGFLVRASALRNSALSLANAFSMGLRSGE
jgi:hypothetical protein